MEFPVSQLREMMGKSEGELVKSGSIPCPILGFTFLLELNPSHQRTMSAKLLLSTGELNTAHLVFLLKFGLSHQV